MVSLHSNRTEGLGGGCGLVGGFEPNVLSASCIRYEWVPGCCSNCLLSLPSLTPLWTLASVTISPVKYFFYKLPCSRCPITAIKKKLTQPSWCHNYTHVPPCLSSTFKFFSDTSSLYALYPKTKMSGFSLLGLHLASSRWVANWSHQARSPAMEWKQIFLPSSKSWAAHQTRAGWTWSTPAIPALERGRGKQILVSLRPVQST